LFVITLRIDKYIFASKFIMNMHVEICAYKHVYVKKLFRLSMIFIVCVFIGRF